MQLYRTYFKAAASDIELSSWQGSQAEASKERSKRKADGFFVIGTESIDIPTMKAPLLEWLNDNVNK